MNLFASSMIGRLANELHIADNSVGSARHFLLSLTSYNNIYRGGIILRANYEFGKLNRYTSQQNNRQTRQVFRAELA